MLIAAIKADKATLAGECAHYAKHVILFTRGQCHVFPDPLCCRASHKNRPCVCAVWRPVLWGLVFWFTGYW
jgi:hypothetical protein